MALTLTAIRISRQLSGRYSRRSLYCSTNWQMAVNSYREWIKFTGITHGCKPKALLKAFKVFILPFIVTEQQQPAMWCKSQFLPWAKTYSRICRSPRCCFWISWIHFYTFPLMLVFSAIRLFKQNTIYWRTNMCLIRRMEHQTKKRDCLPYVLDLLV